MSKNTKKLVPKLRFPEFQDEGEWKSESFEDIYDFKVTNSFSRDMLNYENGSVKNIHYGDIHTKFSTLFDIEKEQVPFINPSVSIDKIKQDCYCIEGDMVFADASEDLAGVGKSIELVNLNGERLVSGLHTILARQKQRKLMLGFGGHLFKSQRIRKQIQKESQGAKVLGLSSGRLAKIKVAYPSDENEQQKIADCLSSIDDLITAQSQKVEALKIHKKGLMQQLFPREGETVPRLRFPKFQDAGEWEEGKLGDKNISIFVKERVSVSNLTLETYVSTENLLSEYEGVTKAARLPPSGSCTKFKEGDILISNIRPYLKKVWQANFSGASSNDVIVIRAGEEIHDFFLNFLLRNDDFIDYIMKGAKGVKMPRGDIDLMKEYPIVYPSPEEQQYIADCLLNIDNLITTQTQKLESLKTHKKGLMQQLFPSVEAVSE